MTWPGWVEPPRVWSEDRVVSAPRCGAETRTPLGVQLRCALLPGHGEQHKAISLALAGDMFIRWQEKPVAH